jgi:hypothetical protein
MSERMVRVPRKLFKEILREADEHHPRPHYKNPQVACGGPGVCADEIRFAKARKLLGEKPSP